MRPSGLKENGNRAWTKGEEMELVQYIDERKALGMKSSDAFSLAADYFKRTVQAVQSRYSTCTKDRPRVSSAAPSVNLEQFVSFDQALQFVKDTLIGKQTEVDQLTLQLDEITELREKLDILKIELQTVKEQVAEWERIAIDSDSKVQSLTQENIDLIKDMEELSAGLRIAQKYADVKNKNPFLKVVE